jgi:zinc/manganese transport system substrate-binding protein
VRTATIAATVLLGALVSGCAASGSAQKRSERPHVVAAENVWGSVAAQLAGPDATVTSIIDDPATDPHSYEPTVADARQVSAARLVIVNGIGYDRWASQLVAASPAPRRLTLTAGSLLHLRTGDNPHQWYDPASVSRVASAIADDLIRIDPAHAAQYAARRTAFDHRTLAAYHAAIAHIRRTYAGVPVGASESIFAPLARALGLRLLTPTHLMDAVAEGTDVSAADAATAEDQITRRQIKVWIYNAQNITPAVAHLNGLARAHGIPVTTVTETLTPRGTSFESWQAAQLAALTHALHAATGR